MIYTLNVIGDVYLTKPCNPEKHFNMSRRCTGASPCHAKNIQLQLYSLLWTLYFIQGGVMIPGGYMKIFMQLYGNSIQARDWIGRMTFSNQLCIIVKQIYTSCLYISCDIQLFTRRSQMILTQCIQRVFHPTPSSFEPKNTLKNMHYPPHTHALHGDVCVCMHMQVNAHAKHTRTHEENVCCER